MERVGTLIERLLEQYKQNAGAAELSVTAQMLLGELRQWANMQDTSTKKVSVVIPNMITQKNNPDENTSVNGKKEEKIIPVETTSAVEDFLKIKTGWHFDPLHDIPTLAHQEKNTGELNEVMASKEESFNERLKTVQTELGSVLQETPVRDLKKAIGINDRFLFINELFRGDEIMYERSVKTINSFSILAEAEYWIKRELKVKEGWDEQRETVKLFDQMVKRRFS